MLRSPRPALGITIAVLLVVAGCGNGNDEPAPVTAPADAAADTALTFAIDDEAAGPAPAIPGAMPGGTITVLDPDDIAHLDPARIYVGTFQAVSNLMTRTLTGYRQSDGTISLVGDLATNTGVSSDGGKTWTYTLRDGITWEDGSAITAADVKYGIERLFEPDYVEGPTYLQEWLTGKVDFRKVYAGPYGGKSFNRVEAPDPRTVVLRFPQPRPDVPFALALTSGAPVKKSADTRSRYDKRPFASGPYKIESRRIDKSMTLVRNPAWKSESDPLRYQYPDRYELEFGEGELAMNRRLIAGSGSDSTAVPLQRNVSAELVGQVQADPDLRARVISGITPFQRQYSINNRRITDLEVRKALLYAFPRQQVRQILGGPTYGDFATTLASPILVGHQAHDDFGVPPEGDVPRARAMLEAAGKLGQKIVYGYLRSAEEQRAAVVIDQTLTEAGFDVVTKPINGSTYYDDLGPLDHTFDLYLTGWGFDWPSGSTVYPPTLDGRKIRAFSTNVSLFNSAAANKEMDRALALTDPLAAGAAWAALDRQIMTEVPGVPFVYLRAFQIMGPQIGGATLDLILGELNLNGLFVKGS